MPNDLQAFAKVEKINRIQFYSRAKMSVWQQFKKKLVTLFEYNWFFYPIEWNVITLGPRINDDIIQMITSSSYIIE